MIWIDFWTIFHVFGICCQKDEIQSILIVFESFLHTYITFYFKHVTFREIVFWQKKTTFGNKQNETQIFWNKRKNEVSRKNEHRFFENICLSLKPNGVFICGSPSLESQVYASKGSKEGHINCKTGSELKELVQNYFENVFLFGMNDEVLHTEYAPMSHNLLTLATGPLIKRSD